MTARWRKPLLIVLAVLAGLVLLAVLAYQLALRRLESVVLAGLGPHATVGEFQVGLAGVDLRDVRIQAERGGADPWPAEDELRARHVRLIPQWRTLWAGDGRPWRVAKVHVEGAYVSVLRTRQGGLRLLPSLLQRPADNAPAGASAVLRNPPAGAPLAVLIGQLVLDDGALDFYDASVSRPANRLQLAKLQVEAGPFNWPALDKPVPLQLRGVLKGLADRQASRDGEVRIDGELTPATRDVNLKVTLKGVDLRVLQPYLLRINEGGVSRGQVDLTLDAVVRQQRLRAPGTVVFTGLELAGKPGLVGSFAGVPQQLVLAAMEKQGRIELQFTLEGRLDDPAFSLNEDLATRLGIGLAKVLGVSVGGVVEGLGSVIKGLFGR